MNKFVKNGHLFVRPLKKDIEFNIAEYLKITPFQSGGVLPEELHVTIFRSAFPLVGVVTETNKNYRATVKGCQQWYNPASKTKNIVLILDSPELVERHKDVAEENKDIYLTTEEKINYVPHMTLAYDIANNTHRYRWWFNDLANAFNSQDAFHSGGRYYGMTINFSGEEIEDSIIYEPDNLDTPTKSMSDVVVRPAD